MKVDTPIPIEVRLKLDHMMEAFQVDGDESNQK
jgi:hypothetical protein